MVPEKVTLSKYYHGDTWKGFKIGPVLFDGNAPTTTLVSCKLQFRDKYDNLGYEYNTVSAICKGLITITDAATWEVTVEPGILDLEKGLWYWDLETVDSAGTIKTIISGKIRIKIDITNGIN